MLNIKILGTGCTNCRRLEEVTRKVIASLGLNVEIEKVKTGITQFEGVKGCYDYLNNAPFVK